MASFKDDGGRTWDLTLGVGSLKRIRSRTGVNLFDALKDDCAVLKKLGDDPLLIFDVVLAALDLDESAGEHWSEQTIVAAAEAFFEALFDFFREKGRSLRVAWGKAKVAVEKRVPAAIAALDQAAEEFDAEVALESYLTSKSSAGSSPDKSEPTPTPTVSES